jgi:hypothetical protein
VIADRAALFDNSQEADAAGKGGFMLLAEMHGARWYTSVRQPPKWARTILGGASD